MLNPNTPINIDTLFSEFKAELSINKDNAFNKEHTYLIDIILNESTDPKKLPYTEIFSPQKLQEWGAERINQCLILARGDFRSPDEILKAGGFHPNFTNPNTIISRHGDNILDLWYHRASATGSGFVSCSASMNAAFIAADGARREHGYSANTAAYVYLVKATGAIRSIAGINAVLDNEYEYTIAGSIDAKDIIAFRQIPRNFKNYERSSIFISNEFLNMHPEKIQIILDAYLQDYESFSKAFKTYNDNNSVIQTQKLKTR